MKFAIYITNTGHDDLENRKITECCRILKQIDIQQIKQEIDL